MPTIYIDSQNTYPVEFSTILTIQANQTITEWLVAHGAPTALIDLLDCYAVLMDTVARLQCGQALSDTSHTLYAECVLDSLNAIVQPGGEFHTRNCASLPRSAGD